MCIYVYTHQRINVLYIDLHEGLYFCKVNVGKYTIHASYGHTYIFKYVQDIYQYVLYIYMYTQFTQSNMHWRICCFRPLFIRSFCHAAPVAARSSVVARVEKLSPSLWCRQLEEKLACGWSKPTGDIPLNPGWLIAILIINGLLQSLHNWVVKSTLQPTQPEFLHYSLFSKRDVGNGFRDVPHEYEKVWCKICKGVVPQFL